MVDLNCEALMAMCQLTIPYMHAGAQIINIASVAACQPVPPKFEGLALPLCRVFGAARRRFRRSSPYTPARRMSFARPPAEIFQLVISSLSGASARYYFRVTAVI